MNKLFFFLTLLFHATICFSQKDSESLIERITKHLDDKHIPGAMVSVVTSDSILFVGGLGFADIDKKEKVTDEHLFRQGSISKSFTAFGILKLLQNQQKYSLDSPIKDIDSTIPFANKWSPKNPVRIVHLLEHTSGFDDFHLHALYNKKDTIPPPAFKMVLAHENSLKSRWKPGIKKAYSNPNYIVAGHLLEQLSGRSYHAYLYEDILHPIGMQSSGFYFKEPKHQKIAQGYQYNGQTHLPVSFTSITGGPAGELCANAKDMATYLQFMLNRKTENGDSMSFSKETFDRIENAKTTIAAKKGLPFGYGLGNYSIWKNGYLFHGHGGGIDGFSSRYVYSRAADIGVAVAINREGNATAVVDEILNLLLGTQNQADRNRVTQKIPDAMSARYSGFYEFKSPRNKLLSFTDKMLAGLILDFDEDKLVTKSILGKVRDTLYYAGDNKFYKNHESVSSCMLFETDEGNAGFWINENYTEKEPRTKRLIIFFGVLISFLVYFSFLIYSFIWLIIRPFSKSKKPILNHLILFGGGICLVLMFVGFGLTMANKLNADKINFGSVLMYLSSWGLAIFTIASIYRCFKLESKKGFKFYYILTSIASLILLIYLWNNGFIGLKLWSY